MKANIYVLDTETTGLKGWVMGDKVVEIGIARVDLDTWKVCPELSMIIKHTLNEDEKEAWVFRNTSLTPRDVETSPHTPLEVARLLHLTYDNCVFTAYNKSFDFDRFLNGPPFHFQPRTAPCLMESAAQIVHTYDHAGRSAYPSAQSAYSTLCPANPANLPAGVEQHRALSDAVMEGHILLAMLEQSSSLYNVYAGAVQ